jgi:alpha-beta hydrolase superfamily lysophospholipase
MTKVVSKVIDWLNNNFQAILNNRAPGVVADIDNRFILMGHSAAGHVVTEYLNDTCGPVKLQILLDPVDGVDPFGIKKDFIINPGHLLPYATPVLVLAAELDPVKKFLEPPCAPDNLSNER